MGFILILLSLCTYPLILVVHPEQRGVWHGELATDIFMYCRAILAFVSALCLTPFLKKPYPPYLAYFLLLLISVLLTKHPYTALFGTPNYYEGFYVICAYLVFGMYGKAPEKALEACVYLISLFGLIQLLHGCYLNFPPIHFFMPKSMTFSSAVRPIYSTFGNSNHLGLFCALLTPFFIAREKWLASFTLLALLVLSQNRGAWVSVFITTLMQHKKYWRFIILIGLPCLILMSPRISEGLSGREFIWANTVPMLKGHWLFGSGPGAYALDFPLKFHDGIVDRPHNMYLNIWYSTGLLSLLVWVYIIKDFFFNCTDKALRMAVLGFLIALLFTDSVVSVTPYFFVLLGAGL